MTDNEVAECLHTLSHDAGQLIGDPFGEEHGNGWWRKLVVEAAKRIEKSARPYKLLGTTTGRFSSSKPNLQNTVRLQTETPPLVDVCREATEELKNPQAARLEHALLGPLGDAVREAIYQSKRAE